MRKRRDYLQWAHDDCVEYADWCSRHLEVSAIGYPQMTAEASAGQGKGSNKPSTICPEIMMPCRVARVDHAVCAMPRNLREVIYRKYFDSKDVGRHTLESALTWIAAAK